MGSQVTLADPATVTIPIALFEKLSLNCDKPRDWNKRYGSPTAIALAGLVMCLTPLSCQLMGWRDSDMSGSANNGAHFYCGGLLLFLGGLLDFFCGNVFSSTVYLSYGGFFFALGATLAPNYGIDAHTENAAGIVGGQFYASYGFFYLFMGLLSFVFLLASLRTNICFVIVFIAYSLAFPLLAAADWEKALGKDKETVDQLLVGGGACCLVVSAACWWVLASILLEAGKICKLPVGDLSGLWGPTKVAADVEKQA